MSDEPHEIVPPRKPRKERRLSEMQLKILHNIACGHDPAQHLRGASAHGAFPQTMHSLERRCLIRGYLGTKPELTMAGLQAHRTLCCEKGRTENEEFIAQAERALSGRGTEPLYVRHEDLESMSEEDSPPVRCPACLVGVLIPKRGKTGHFLRTDRCHRCGQTFKYVGQEICGERPEDDDGEE